MPDQGPRQFCLMESKPLFLVLQPELYERTSFDLRPDTWPLGASGSSSLQQGGDRD